MIPYSLIKNKESAQAGKQTAGDLHHAHIRCSSTKSQKQTLKNNEIICHDHQSSQNHAFSYDSC
jgi:hypothetical protein